VGSVSVIRSNTKGCNVGVIKVIASEKDFLSVADAMRGALGDNPCVLNDHDDGAYHFSDSDLVTAFIAAKTKE